MIELPEVLAKAAGSHKYPLLFATVSGAHLYGFPSPDSDYDMRGVHILPLEAVVGLHQFDETLEFSDVREGIELDLVTHDAKKFFGLLLKKNGYVLEQLYSPIIVCAREEHAELKEIATRCITRNHCHHYIGFAEKQWQMFNQESPPRVKPLLYVYRVLLTGIHLMRTGAVEANINILNQDFKLPFLTDLIARKTNGVERELLENSDLEFHAREYTELMNTLKDAAESSHLPESPSAQGALDDLLKRIRLGSKVGAR